MFIPLHAKSDYSLGYGCNSIEELVDRAAALGYPALALTDIENLYGQVRFHHQCQQRGIRAITGVELRPGFNGRNEAGTREGRLILLAADQTGYRNLCRITSRRRCRDLAASNATALPTPLEVVSDHPERLFALSDDPQVVEQLIGTGSFQRQMLGLLVVRPQRSRYEPCLLAAKRLGVRLVADLDCVFLQQEDHPLHLLQTAIRKRVLLEDLVESDIEKAERWLRPPMDVAALFADLPEAVTASEEIATACFLELGPLTLGSPAFSLSAEEPNGQQLRQLCDQLVKKSGDKGRWDNAHRCRLEQELSVFESLNFTTLMLMVAEILRYCQLAGIPAVAKGSAVSSLTLHLLGGSPIDPLAEGLLFERFLHPGKSAWPDVDLDLPYHRRDEVIDWVYQRFGPDRVAMVAAHHTFQYHSALREGLKALGAKPSLIERLSRALSRNEPAVAEVDFLGLAKNSIEDDPLAVDSVTQLPLIRRLVGRPRHIAVHPGGIVIDQRPLNDLLPLELAPKGVIITQYDLMAVARLGLIKIDLLGNRCLSEIVETLELAGHRAPKLESIPAKDPATFQLINSADTIGCFQLESPAMRSLLAGLPIRGQADLIAALALIRPGAAAGDVKQAFIRRACGKEPPQSEFPFMADRLAETHGLFLYEEDIMILFSRGAGLTLAEADEMRRAIIKGNGDPDQLANLEESFREKGVAKGINFNQLRRIWNTAVRLAAYSFNKAHAASYARLAYYSAYTKVHYPLQFACSLINQHQGLYPLRTLAADFVRNGIALAAPHVNSSGYKSFCEINSTGQGAVRVGLDKLKGFRQRSADELVEERNRGGLYASLSDLLTRVRLNQGEVTALILSGAGAVSGRRETS